MKRTPVVMNAESTLVPVPGIPLMATKLIAFNFVFFFQNFKRRHQPRRGPFIKKKLALSCSVVTLLSALCQHLSDRKCQTADSLRGSWPDYIYNDN